MIPFWLWRAFSDLGAFPDLGYELGATGAMGIAVCMLPITAALSWLLLPYAKWGRGKVVPWPVAIAIGVLLLGLLVAWNATRLANNTIIDVTLRDVGYRSDGSHVVSEAQMIVLDVMFMVGLAGLIAVPPLCIIVVTRWIRESRGVRASRLIVGITSGAMLLLTALGLLSVLEGVNLLVPREQDTDEWFRRLYDLRLSPYEPLDSSRTLLWWIAIVGSLGVLVLPVKARSDIPLRSKGMRNEIAVSTIGLLVWLLNRSAAYDGHHPLPLLPDPGSLGLRVDVPSVAKCNAFPDAPLLEVLDDSTALIDGDPAPTPSDAESAMTLKRKRYRLNPDDELLGPHRLLVAARPSAPAGSVLPMIRAAARAGHAQPLVVVLHPPRRTVVTRTLGVLARHPHHCVVPIPVDDELPSAATWGEVTAQLEAKLP